MNVLLIIALVIILVGVIGLVWVSFMLGLCMLVDEWRMMQKKNKIVS
jgi:hypothetical protein